MQPLFRLVFIALAASAWLPISSPAQQANAPKVQGDYSQWCGRTDRNRVYDATGLVESFDEVSAEHPAGSTLRNVRWVARLGAASYASPVVADGKVYMGGCLNAPGPRNTSALWCFNEADGKLLWQLRSPFIKGICNQSWGITAAPTVEGNRVYCLGVSGEVYCLDTGGLANGNDGPFQDEGLWLSQREVVKNEIAPDDRRVVEYSPALPVKPEANDADIIWRFDMVNEARCWPYNAANASIIVRGDYLYVPTCSADCNIEPIHKKPLTEWKASHPNSSYPSPNIIVLDKKTGKLVAEDATGSFGRSYHGAHSSPALGTINGQETLVWAGGDGICYGLDPKFEPGKDGKPALLKTLWQVDCLNPRIAAPDGSKVFRQEIFATPVIYKDKVYIATIADLAGKRIQEHSRLLCIDPKGTGDITASACVWRFDDIRSCSSTVAIADGLLYTADVAGLIYCLDAASGKPYWTHPGKEIWASPLLADGKLYVPTNGKGLIVLAAAKEKKVVFESPTTSRMVASPALANGTLYFADQKYLYAVGADPGANSPSR